MPQVSASIGISLGAALLLAFSAAPARADGPTESGTAPTPKEPNRVAGTLELRLQTASNLSSGGALSFETSPGFAYATSARRYLVNALGGIGYFVTASAALGVDASYTLYHGDATQTLVALTPYVKFVRGMARQLPGLFLELSPGYVFEDLGHGEHAHFFELTAWPGLHLPVNRSVAIVAGPSVTTIQRLDAREPSGVLFGLRAGLSLYVPASADSASTPSNSKPERAFYGKGTTELRFQTATNTPTGGRLAPGTPANNLTYSTHSGELLLNTIAGGGVFVTSALELGAELGTSYLANKGFHQVANPVGFAFFGRYVSGMQDFRPGVFAEFAPGVLAYVVYGGSNYGVLLQENLWVGGHFPSGSSLAFVVGPTVTRSDNVVGAGGGDFVVGLRFGMSVYFPSRRSKATGQSTR